MRRSPFTAPIIVSFFSFLVLAYCSDSGSSEGGGDKEDKQCQLEGTKVLVYEKAEPSDESCPPSFEVEVNFDSEETGSDSGLECDEVRADEESCTAYMHCYTEDGGELTMNFNVQDGKLTGTIEAEFLTDEGDFVHCTYLVSTK